MVLIRLMVARRHFIFFSIIGFAPYSKIEEDFHKIVLFQIVTIFILRKLE